MEVARESLNNFILARVRLVDLVIQARWMADGDKGTQLFYKTFKGLAMAKDIPELLNQSDQVIGS